MFRSPKNNSLQLVGRAAQATRRSSTPVVSVGGMYAPIRKERASHVTSWNVWRFGDAMVTASTSKS